MQTQDQNNWAYLAGYNEARKESLGTLGMIVLIVLSMAIGWAFDEFVVHNHRNSFQVSIGGRSVTCESR